MLPLFQVCTLHILNVIPDPLVLARCQGHCWVTVSLEAHTALLVPHMLLQSQSSYLHTA